MNQSKYKSIGELYSIVPILELVEIPMDDVICSDKPDIRIKKDGKIIGIEETKCFSSENVKKAYSRQDHICKQYEKYLSSQGYNGVQVRLQFEDNLHEILQKKKFNPQLIDEIFEELERYREKGEMNDDRKWYTIHPREYYHFRYVDWAEFKQTNSENNIVLETRSWIYYTVKTEWVKQCIENKEKSLQEYKMLDKNKDVDEYWLCVNVPTETGCYFDYFTDTFNSEYQRIYLTQNKDIKRIK